MGLSRVHKILLAIFAASVVATVIGLFLGYPFFALFLFFPGLLSIFGNRSDTCERPGVRYCPECGYEVDPDDTFCRVCGRHL